MDSKDNVTQFTTREEWLNKFVDKARIMFEAVDAPLPEKVRVSIGHSSKGVRSKVIGECWAAEASADKVCEIFIIPGLQSDPVLIAATLTHELVHAAVGHEAKHGPKFRKPTVALGLEGKMTATVPGEAWHSWADPILAELGPFPGAALTGMLPGGKKKQGTRMIKVECGGCGWSFRTAQKNIDAMTDHTCLACGDGVLVAASAGGEDAGDAGDEDE